MLQFILVCYVLGMIWNFYDVEFQNTVDLMIDFLKRNEIDEQKFKKIDWLKEHEIFRKLVFSLFWPIYYIEKIFRK